MISFFDDDDDIYPKRYRSDAWDSGNSLTCFYEEVIRCPECGGEGSSDGEICDACGGEGEVTVYRSA